jgi:uncharacterized protein
METVRFFQPTNDFLQRVQTIFEMESDRTARLIPRADIEHVGATSVPGAVTKGDVDIQVRVAQRQFKAATRTLKSLYEIHQPENWSENFASFQENQLHPLLFCSR